MNNGDLMSFEKSLDTIEKYGKVSGVFLNIDKNTSDLAWKQKTVTN